MTEAVPADPGAIFDAHVRAEFVERDIQATMATMSESPYVTHVPVLTGGCGREEVQRFYERYFIGRWPADTQISPVSRTSGQGRVIDELIMRFTHDVPMPALLPGVSPTGCKVELPVVVVMGVADGKVTSTSTGTRLRSWCRSGCWILRRCRLAAPSRHTNSSIQRCHRTRSFTGQKRCRRADATSPVTACSQS